MPISNLSFSNAVSRCDRCGRESVIHDGNVGEIFCKSCGFVIVEKINEVNSDLINFDDGKDNRRTGAPLLMSVHDFGLSTMIGVINKDAKGKPISALTSATIRRIRIQDNRSQLHNNVDINFKLPLVFYKGYMIKFVSLIMLKNLLHTYIERQQNKKLHKDAQLMQ